MPGVGIADGSRRVRDGDVLFPYKAARLPDPEADEKIADGDAYVLME